VIELNNCGCGTCLSFYALIILILHVKLIWCCDGWRVKICIYQCILFFKTLYLPILKCLYFFIDRKKWIVAGVPCLHEATRKFLQTYTRCVFGLCPGDLILLIIIFSGCHSCICFASEKYLSIVPWNYALSLHLVVTNSPSVAEMTSLFFFYCKERIKYDEKDPCRN